MTVPVIFGVFILAVDSFFLNWEGVSGRKATSLAAQVGGWNREENATLWAAVVGPGRFLVSGALPLLVEGPSEFMRMIVIEKRVVIIDAAERFDIRNDVGDRDDDDDDVGDRDDDDVDDVGDRDDDDDDDVGEYSGEEDSGKEAGVTSCKVEMRAK